MAEVRRIHIEFTNQDLRRLIVPLVIEQLLAITVGLFDSVMVSQVGEAAISAVSLVDTVNVLLVNAFSALATGGAVIAGQYLGRREAEKAGHSGAQLLLFMGEASLLIMALFYLAKGFVLGVVFGQVEPDVAAYANTYYMIVEASIPFLAIYSAGAALFRVMGNSKISMWVSLMMNLINVAGNAILIFGVRMGVEGVAIPTLVSRGVAAVVMVGLLRRPGLPLRVEKFTLRHDRYVVKNILRFGVPNGLESSMFQLGRVFTLSMISGFGTYQIAANSTAGALTNFAVIATTTTRIASLTVIGQCVGAHDMEQIKVNFRKLMIISYISHAVFAILTVIFRFPLIHLYKKLEPETVELAAQLLCIHLIPAIFLYPLSFFTSGPLRAANDSAFPMWVSILSMAIFRLTLAQILCVNLGWGAVGVWWAMIVDWCCRSVCFTVRWYRGKWRKKCGLDTLEVTQ